MDSISLPYAYLLWSFVMRVNYVPVNEPWSTVVLTQTDESVAVGVVLVGYPLSLWGDRGFEHYSGHLIMQLESQIRKSTWRFIQVSSECIMLPLNSCLEHMRGGWVSLHHFLWHQFSILSVTSVLYPMRINTIFFLKRHLSLRVFRCWGKEWGNNSL